jgi:DNA-binding CsgD family transcriptional regulator
MPGKPRSLVVGAAGPSLTRWGCSPDADLVYRALTTLGPRTGRGLKRDLGLTATRVDRAIDELTAAGAVSSGRRRREGVLWIGRPASEVSAALQRARSVRRAPSTDVTVAARAAVATAVGPAPIALGEGLRHLPTRALTRVRLAELADVVRHEQLAMNPEHAFEPESVRAATPLDRRLMSRGVAVRVLGVQPLDADPLASFGPLPAARRPGYRQALHVPMKLCVIDRKVALFPVDPGDFNRGYLEVTQAPIVAALVSLFDRHWEHAWDPREATMPSIDLSRRERELITLLAQGHTDATAARELGISTRSVSNILRPLMDRLQVDNRFQLGLALGALRALPPPHAATEPIREEHHAPAPPRDDRDRDRTARRDHRGSRERG